MSSDTTANYFVGIGNTLEFDSNCFKLTTGSAYRYIHYGSTSNGITGTALNNYKGKTITLKAYVEPSYQCRVGIYYLLAGATSYQSSLSNYTSSSGEIEVSMAIPNDVSRLLFRVDATSNNAGETVKVKDFRVYPI